MIGAVLIAAGIAVLIACHMTVRALREVSRLRARALMWEHASEQAEERAAKAEGELAVIRMKRHIAAKIGRQAQLDRRAADVERTRQAVAASTRRAA